MTRYLCPACRTEPGVYRVPEDWMGAQPGSLLCCAHPAVKPQFRFVPEMPGGACRGTDQPPLEVEA